MQLIRIAAFTVQSLLEAMKPREDQNATSFKKGIVVLLDFLGVSTLGSEETVKFLVKHNNVLATLEKAKSGILRPGTQEIGVRTFGDSILLTWPTGMEHSDDVLLFGELLKHVFHFSISQRLLVRGVIAAGEFIESSAPNHSVVLGPAVADAAGWERAADWSGIIATPRTGHLLDFREMRTIHEGELDVDVIFRTFVKYDVPLKTGKRKMWCLAWPEFLSIVPGSDEKRAATFYEQISLFPSIPVGTEGKYSNTMEFFDWYWANHYARVKDKNPPPRMT